MTQAALSEPLATERPAWRDIPSWFVFGDADLSIPDAVHRATAQALPAEGRLPDRYRLRYDRVETDDRVSIRRAGQLTPPGRWPHKCQMSRDI
ncbi:MULTISPECIES: hypothetical protein [unclassified Microbacterium]|uniref:hypothetical protein n=1 Tax=unclassified Microbacterium TaxID=2609290 RepID=UPI00214C0FD2|nr:MULTISPECIES: hypothetical protein [unclassified Microbacterium]MCR2809503.1 hypothetical protein [Microbacterium sp. zg.B185]WIM20637.1 hypothetical protein QNO12_07555 [Microbacterium sp. zg-B185]